MRYRLWYRTIGLQLFSLVLVFVCVKVPRVVQVDVSFVNYECDVI